MSIDARFNAVRGAFRLDVAFSIPADGVTAVFGPSGAGKTTLLRIIAGLEANVDGHLRVGDDRWQDADRRIPAHERAVGFVFQDAALFPHLDVAGNLRYGFDRTPEAARRISLDEAVAWLGIAKLLTRDTRGLSGGERQRVAIARALLTSPRLLLLDEPLASLDADGKADILPYLERLRDELDLPMLYVSHAADEVARLADHMLLLDAGRLRASGPVRELLTRLDLPPALGADAEAIVDGRVAAHDEGFELTYVDFGGGRFSVARNDLPVGRGVRLRVMARDVSLTLAHQSDTSILNVFPATVTELNEERPGRTTVRLDVGGTIVLAQVTRKSAVALRLEPGQAVFAQVKSVALLA